MARFGFCGPAYTSSDLSADAQECINLYLEHDESGAGKSEYQLLASPGLQLHTPFGSHYTPGTPGAARGGVNANGRVFAVTGDLPVEIFSTLGKYLPLGGPASLANDGKPCSFAFSTTQLLICSGNLMYLYQLDTSTWIGQVGVGLGDVAAVAYSDGFFLALKANSQQIFASAPLDASTWNGLSTAIVSVFPDKILSMRINQREIWLRGATKSVAYSNVGASPFPFSANLSSYMEQGTVGEWGEVNLDNTLFWLGANERGHLIAWRLSGYNPQRVSNHAVETAWSKYAETDDVIGWTYEDQGHSFWRLYFPTANVTWQYDVATQTWTKVGWLNPQTGLLEAHRGAFHVFGFGRHLVFDRQNPNMYWMDTRAVDDNGCLIQRLRRAPYVSTENRMLRHSRLEIDLQHGLDPMPKTPPIAGVTLTAAGEPNPLLGGILYAVAVGLDSSFTVQQSVVLGPVALGANQSGAVFLPPSTGVEMWRIFFANDPGGPTSMVAISEATVATFGGRVIYLSSLIFPAVGSYQAVVSVSINALTKARNVQLMLRWSDDGAETWKNPLLLDVGTAGAYSARAIAYRLGRSRARVYEASATDIIPWRFTDAYLDATGFQPTERLAAQLRKSA